MSVSTLHENDVEGVNLPGRNLRWLVNSELLGSKYMSVCVINVAPGETVRPAHSHPNGEEVIYIITGSGRVMVEGEVSPVKAGSVVLFPQGAVHMLQNNGQTEMKVVCFFAPATNLDNYKFYENIEFPPERLKS
jgi:quercetin dioxygenase-like cupin family protein